MGKDASDERHRCVCTPRALVSTVGEDAIDERHLRVGLGHWLSWVGVGGAGGAAAPSARPSCAAGLGCGLGDGRELGGGDPASPKGVSFCVAPIFHKRLEGRRTSGWPL